MYESIRGVPMFKLTRNPNAFAKICKNFFSPTVISSLVTLSMVFVIYGSAWADEKIIKSHGFNFF